MYASLLFSDVTKLFQFLNMYKFNTNDYLIRIPLFVIFFWFGLLKVIELFYHEAIDVFEVGIFEI